MQQYVEQSDGKSLIFNTFQYCIFEVKFEVLNYRYIEVNEFIHLISMIING